MNEEYNPSQGEKHEKPDELSVEKARAQQEQIRNRLEREAEKAAEKSKHTSYEQVRNKAETEAEDLEKIRQKFEDREEQQKPQYNYESNESVPRAVVQARRQLKPYEQKVSKFIHNSKVETVSAVAGSTIARPSGLLWGSMFSFIGTSAFYITSLIFGYQYNAFVAIIAFVGGFFLGLILEFFTRKIRQTTT